jgi:hypothetical protein
MNDRRAWLVLLAALLCGCAQIHWERAVYEGVRQGAKDSAACSNDSLSPWERVGVRAWAQAL